MWQSKCNDTRHHVMESCDPHVTPINAMCHHMIAFAWSNWLCNVGMWYCHVASPKWIIISMCHHVNSVMCHMLLTCCHIHVSNLTMNGQMNLVVFDNERSNENWPNWISQVITKHHLFDQVMSRKTLKNG
jgi:hypothetical protein